MQSRWFLVLVLLAAVGCRPKAPHGPAASLSLPVMERRAAAGELTWQDVLLEARWRSESEASDSIEAWLTRARAADALDYFAEAFASYESYLDLEPFSDQVEAIARWEYELALACLKRGWRVLPEAGTENEVPLTRVLRRAIAHSPFADYAPDAQMRLGELYAQVQAHEDASLAFHQLRTRYPDSNWTTQAILRYAQESLRAEDALPYSEVRLGQIRDLFISVIRRELEGPLVALSEEGIAAVDARRAEHRWAVSRLYRRWHEDDAAEVYENHILAEFPKSRAAARISKDRAKE